MQWPALVIHTDAPFTAKLKTGSAMMNKLWSNILWGQRSNFVGLPTDCPQRDERLGWMADAQVFWRTATYNMDLAAFSRKFAADMRGTQVGNTVLRDLRARDSDDQHGHRRGMERCGRDHSVDLVAADRRHDASSSRTGRRWRSILPRSRLRIPTDLWKNDSAIHSATGFRPRARPTRRLSRRRTGHMT